MRWEHTLAARLQAAGYDVQIDYAEAAPSARFLDCVMALESLWVGAPAEPAPFVPAAPPSGGADAILDLTGRLEPGQAPVLTVEVGGCALLSEGLLRLRSDCGPIQLVARCNGKAVGRAAPMIHDRVWLSRDIRMLLVSIQSLFVQSLARLQAGLLDEITVPPATAPSHRPEVAYAKHLIGGLAARMLTRMTPGSRTFSWKTAYRFIDGPGVVETRHLGGAPFSFLEDDGQRFYADPFPIHHEGRTWLFVEEYPYASRRGVISVAELGPDGRFARPRVVLEEAHHLSYPNVFTHEGSLFMIPESGSAQEVVLYRAAAFPDCWQREAVLIEGRNFNDATLFQHEGRFWMLGTERYAGGSASDTMAIYSAERLQGPWRPHPLNPIVIDRAGARPGGRIVHVNGKAFLPVQNGTDTYGGGLGLREILRLDATDVRFGPVLPICQAEGKGPASLHTINRTGRLEVIDSLL